MAALSEKELIKTKNIHKKCFIVAPIGSADSDIRRRSDGIFEFLLKPVLKELGYAADRGDTINHPGTITSQVIERLVEDELVIADLTGTNANVLYELAVRHTTGKPFIQIAESEEDLPFDIVQNRTIFFNYKDLPSTEQFKKTLKEQILSIEKNPDDIYNPIAKYFAVKQVRSADAQGQLTADIYERLEKYSNYFQDIKDGVNQLVDSQTADQSKYITGEIKAFEALTNVTKRARTTIRSTRFFPDSVLTQPIYVNAMEQRVNGSDGKPPLRHYYRIVALNNPEKQKDIIRHLNSCQGRPFDLYLTSNENAFELVIVDETDAFIHFYEKEKIIDATLHIQGVTVVKKFIEIFDKLKERDLLAEFNCENIVTRANFTDALDRVNEIFSEVFPEEHL